MLKKMSTLFIVGLSLVALWQSDLRTAAIELLTKVANEMEDWEMRRLVNAAGGFDRAPATPIKETQDALSTSADDQDIEIELHADRVGQPIIDLPMTGSESLPEPIEEASSLSASESGVAVKNREEFAVDDSLMSPLTDCKQASETRLFLITPAKTTTKAYGCK